MSINNSNVITIIKDMNFWSQQANMMIHGDLYGDEYSLNGNEPSYFTDIIDCYDGKWYIEQEEYSSDLFWLYTETDIINYMEVRNDYGVELLTGNSFTYLLMPKFGRLDTKEWLVLKNSLKVNNKEEFK